MSLEIPNIEELQKKLLVIFHKKGRITVILKENIFFRIFGFDMILPKGLQSDGNSLPFFLLPFMSPYDLRWVFAGLVHDYIYRTQFLPKKIADAIFYEILKKTAGKGIAFLFYEGVNIGGFLAWYNNSKKLVKFPKAKYDLYKYICRNFTESKVV